MLLRTGPDPSPLHTLMQDLSPCKSSHLTARANIVPVEAEEKVKTLLQLNTRCYRTEHYANYGPHIAGLTAASHFQTVPGFTGSLGRSMGYGGTYE